MSLRSTFRELYANAAAREREGTPGSAYRTLKGGAGIRVRSQGRKRQVILGRRGSPVGEVEIVTFCRDGDIPADAERADYLGTGGWHFVAFTWERAEQAGLPLLELPPSL